MDNEYFESIYKSLNLIDTDTVSNKIEISNSRNERIEKVTLTEDEELDRWYDLDDGDPNAFVEYKNFQRFMYLTTLIP